MSEEKRGCFRQLLVHIREAAPGGTSTSSQQARLAIKPGRVSAPTHYLSQAAAATAGIRRLSTNRPPVQCAGMRVLQMYQSPELRLCSIEGLPYRKYLSQCGCHKTPSSHRALYNGHDERITWPWHTTQHRIRTPKPASPHTMATLEISALYRRPRGSCDPGSAVHPGGQE